MNSNAHRGKVLIVDDEKGFRSAFAILLRMRRWHVLEAADGNEAIHKAQHEKPDVLMLDHRMPGLTGIEVYSHLRELGMDIPAVLITAATDAERLARSVGIPRYLRKPFVVEQIDEILDQLVSDE